MARETEDKHSAPGKLNLQDATFEIVEGGIDAHLGDTTYGFRNYRGFLAQAYLYGCGSIFEGAVSAIHGKQEIIFERLRTLTTLSDGMTEEGIVDHVHIFEVARFRQKKVEQGDFVRFYASVYPYQRKDGSCDFGLEDCSSIEKIEAYELPTKEDLQRQAATQLVCQVLCPVADQCYGLYCLMPNGWRDELVAALMGKSSRTT